MASEMMKRKEGKRIDLCDFSKFMLEFKAGIVLIDMIYKKFTASLVPVLLRDALRKDGARFLCRFLRLVPRHFRYFVRFCGRFSDFRE